MQAFLFVAGGETYQMIRGTPLRLAQAYILVNARGWRPWCPSIQCSVPLGAGGFFPKIASQRALVARGGLCEFGARSNWPPGMPALIMFPKFQISFIFNFVSFPPTKMRDSSFFSKISTTLSLSSFSYSGIGRGWKCVEALTPTGDQGVVPPWRKILLLRFSTFLLDPFILDDLVFIMLLIFCYPRRLPILEPAKSTSWCLSIEPHGSIFLTWKYQLKQIFTSVDEVKLKNILYLIPTGLSTAIRGYWSFISFYSRVLSPQGRFKHWQQNIYKTDNLDNRTFTLESKTPTFTF